MIKNPAFRNWNSYNYFIKKDFISQISLYDKAIIDYNGSVIEGEITFVSIKGINIRTNYGDKFYKWYHVKEVYKNNIKL